MEQYIQISKINDFLYSPVSVYLHSFFEDFKEKLYKEKPQIIGTINHKNIDEGKYSSKKNILSGLSVYSNKYKIMGKIDIFNKDTKELIERKTKIKKIYKGYEIQLFAQYFCLKEMGYEVEKLFLHSLEDNKRYKIKIPTKKDQKEFSQIIKKIQNFNPEDLLKNSCDFNSRNSIYKTLSW